MSKFNNITLFQTLEDKGNPNEIEDFGPFMCRRKNDAWLDVGYYFWDSDIQLGHWWGIKVYGINRYIICRCEIEKDVYFWDLHGDGAARIEFIEIKRRITALIKDNSEVFVVDVIRFMRENGIFPYKGVRVLSQETINEDKLPPGVNLGFSRFVNNRKSYFDENPAIQVCIYDKTAFNLQSYCIVYPEHYCEEIYA